MSVRRTTAAAVATLLVALAACAPPAPPSVPKVTVDVVAGTRAAVSIPADGAAVLTDVTVTGVTPGVTVTASAAVTGTPPAPTISVTADAAPDATPGVRIATLTATGCSVTPAAPEDPCPTGSAWTMTRTVEVSVNAPTAEPPVEFAPVSEASLEETPDGTFVAPGVYDLSTESPATAESMGSLAVRLGATILGADTTAGLYRFKVPDAPAAEVAFSVEAGVTYFAPFESSPPQTNAVPGDFTGASADHTWQYSQVGVNQVWGSAAAGTPHLGVADYGIYGEHPDLRPNVASYDPARGDARAAWGDRADLLKPAVDHGTHVSGTACAAGNNGWSVGASPSCRLHALDLAGSNSSTAEDLLALRGWLFDHPEIRVVNMSFMVQKGGAHQNNGCQNAIEPGVTEFYREKLVKVFTNVLFVVAAGNCGKTANGTSARESVRDSVPANLSIDPTVTNVLSVSATIRGSGASRTLASSSTIDGNVAAPGGSSAGGQLGVWSDTYTCDRALLTDRYCSSITPAGDYKSGTSMAAPLVTGIAGLMLDRNPQASAAQLKSCLLQAAVTPVGDIQNDGPRAGLPKEVWAPHAVACAGALIGGPAPTPPPTPPAAPTYTIGQGASNQGEYQAAAEQLRALMGDPNVATTMGSAINTVHGWEMGCIQDFRGGRFTYAGLLSRGCTGAAYPVVGKHYQYMAEIGTRALGYPYNASHRWGAGWTQDFDGGTLGWVLLMHGDNVQAAKKVFGGIRDRYIALGGAPGPLGYPRTDEYQWNGFVRQDFEGGSIVWSASTGAVGISETVIDEPALWGPAQYWTRFTGVGWDGDLWRTYSEGAGNPAVNGAEWVANITGGKYVVEVFVPSSHAVTPVNYYVRSNAGQTVVSVNQTLYNNQWVSLGVYDINGPQASVGANDATGVRGREIAFDAIRWTRVG